MPKKDYYGLLGISRSAKSEEIKRAYHRLAHQFHPDKNPGNRSAEEHFKTINEAYTVLQDMEKRAAYDRASRIERERVSIRFDEFDERSAAALDDLLEGILDDFFGGRQPRPRSARGPDQSVHLEITLEEAACGVIKELRMARTSVCPLCQGSRCAPGTGYIRCPSCHGMGSFRGQKGFFIVDSICGSCQGRGEIMADPCPNCAGRGFRKVNRAFRVQIPAGVDEGTRLRIRGQGEVNPSGGLAGDLFLNIAVRRHSFFQREGDDLFCRVSIPRREARRGTTVEVPTLNGSVAVKIPAGTKSGKIFTLKGEGMPSLGGKDRGDQKVTILVQ